MYRKVCGVLAVLCMGIGLFASTLPFGDLRTICICVFGFFTFPLFMISVH